MQSQMKSLMIASLKTFIMLKLKPKQIITDKLCFCSKNIFLTRCSKI